jgi:hypothetical protein
MSPIIYCFTYKIFVILKTHRKTTHSISSQLHNHFYKNPFHQNFGGFDWAKMKLENNNNNNNNYELFRLKKFIFVYVVHVWMIVQ